MGNVRNLTPKDRPMLEKWIADDPEHVGVSADFFYAPNTTGYVFEDEHGPVLILRASRCLRIDMQFQQNQAERTAKTLKWGCAWLEDKAKRAGFVEMAFESMFPPLMRFCTRHLGFKAQKGDFIKDIVSGA